MDIGLCDKGELSKHVVKSGKEVTEFLKDVETVHIMHFNIRSLRRRGEQLETKTKFVVHLSEYWLQADEVCSTGWSENYNCVSHFSRKSFIGRAVAIFVK